MLCFLAFLFTHTLHRCSSRCATPYEPQVACLQHVCLVGISMLQKGLQPSFDA